MWWNWNGSLPIPDNNTSWNTGINANPPSGVPSNAYVTRVKVHHEITHTYIGDLECKVYNSTHTWMVRDNEGGSDDNINETRTEYSTFDGDDPTQSWYYRVRDIAPADVGTLDVIQLYVYYDVPTQYPDLTKQTDNISQTSGYPGDTLNSTLTVVNQGTASAGSSSYVYYYWKKDSYVFSDTYKVESGRRERTASTMSSMVICCAATALGTPRKTQTATDTSTPSTVHERASARRA